MPRDRLKTGGALSDNGFFFNRLKGIPCETGDAIHGFPWTICST